MSQQFLTQYVPMVNVDGVKMIPVAAIGGQTREGKDEIITGAGNMVFDPAIGDNGMWVPVSEENPLPIALTGNIAETIEALEERVSELTPSRLEHYFRAGTLENGAVEVVFDSGAGESLSLMMLEFTSESESAQIEVGFYDAENAIATFTHLTGAGLNGGSFASLSALNTAGGTGGTGLFEITEWNEEPTPKLRRAILRPEYTPFPFPNGLRVRVRNNSGEDFRCACRVVVLR